MQKMNFPTKGMLTLLQRWCGAEVCLWSYTVSHRMLTIRFHNPDQPLSNLGLWAGDVQYIQAPTSWSHSNIELSVDGKDEFGDDLLLLTDRAANVCILGGIIEVAENLKRLGSIERIHSSEGRENQASPTALESLPPASLYALLTKWSGAQARLWSYTADGRRLTIRLETEERDGNLHIVISGTEYVMLPHIWWHSQICFSVERDNWHGRDVTVLTDREANVRIVGSRVDAWENVEPLEKFIWPREVVKRVINWRKAR